MICNRCSTETNYHIRSMFNEQTICMDCKDKEMKHPDYKKAQDADHQQIMQGNYNFKGIGKPTNL